MLTATTDGLNSIFRQDVNDLLRGADDGPSDSENLWKEDEVYRYMTVAIDALAKDTEGLFRIMQLPVHTGVQDVPISRNILHIRYIRKLSTGGFLRPANVGDTIFRSCDDYGVQLYNGTFSKAGPLYNVFRDYQKSALTLTPLPQADDTLEIEYTATVSVPQAAGMMLPFMDTEDQYLLLCKMKSLAYEKQDADAMDLKRSETFGAKYQAGALIRAGRLNSYRREPGQVVCDW